MEFGERPSTLPLPLPRKDGPPPSPWGWLPSDGRPPPPGEPYYCRTRTLWGRAGWRANSHAPLACHQAHSDVAICTTRLYIVNGLLQSRCPCRAGVYHTRPRGKHGCVIRFHFTEFTSKSPAKVQRIQMAVPRHTLACKTTHLLATKFWGWPSPPPPREGQGVGKEQGERGGGLLQQKAAKGVILHGQ